MIAFTAIAEQATMPWSIFLFVSVRRPSFSHPQRTEIYVPQALSHLLAKASRELAAVTDSKTLAADGNPFLGLPGRT
jgi:hypothetical protein